MGLALAVGKGRSAASQIRGVLREVCALTLGCRLHLGVRWAPSERNPSDAPSRGCYCIKGQGGPDGAAAATDP
eukprot:7779110-Pyramimonas_sp.AAC.1